jgi:hypothetical protein
MERIPPRYCYGFEEKEREESDQEVVILSKEQYSFHTLHFVDNK